MAPIRAHVEFDAASVAPRDRVEAWRDFYSGFTHVHSLAPNEAAIRAHLRAWRIGDLIFGHHTYGPSVTSMAADNRFDDRLILRVLLRGMTRGIVGDAPLVMKPGAVYLRDRSHGFYGVHSDMEVLSLSVPYGAVGYDPTRFTGPLAFDFGAPRGRILRANIEAIHASLPALTPDEGQLMAEGVSALLRTFVRRDTKDDGGRQSFENARELALRRYIDDHLRDPSLTIPQICQAIGVSRATLQRVFAADGGVGRFVLHRRLERALQDLAQSAPRRGLVTAVAERWAFADAAHFARQFRARFGFRPIEVVGSAFLPVLDHDAPNALRVTRAPTLVSSLASLVA